MASLSHHDRIEVYSVTFLCCEGLYLLLQRASDKAFAPLRWTGLGGHVEPEEFGSLRNSAIREIWEESGILEKDIQNFTLRRVILTNRPNSSLGVLLYFTGVLQHLVLPTCPEGQLFWLTPEQFDSIDIIENTRPVLDCLVEDMRSDPYGANPIKTGLGVFNSQGAFQRVIWG